MFCENVPPGLLDRATVVGVAIPLEVTVKEPLVTLINPDNVAGGVTVYLGLAIGVPA
jgi:hypothetical protein